MRASNRWSNEEASWRSLSRFLRIEALKRSTRRGRVRNYRFTMTSGRQGVFESPRVGIDIPHPRSCDNDGKVAVIAFAKSIQRISLTREEKGSICDFIFKKYTF